jgi:acyl-CoA synthetase (NDP forming)
MDVAAGAALLERAGIPTFRYPDDAARVFNLMWRYDANIRALVEGGGEVAPLATRHSERFDAVLPAHWSHGNPVDVPASR